MLERSWEYWAALVGMALYLASRDAENEAVWRRFLKIAASGALAYGTSASLAPWLGDSEILAAIVVMGFGLTALDVGTAIVADREFLKELIRRKLGGDR